MIIRYVILCQLAPVLPYLFLQKVGSVGLLQQNISGIFFVPQNVLDSAGGPGRPSCWRQDSIIFQSSSYLARCVPAQIIVENAGDDSRPFRLNFRLPIGALAITQEVTVVEGKLSFLVSPPHSHRHILADGFAFCLGKGAEPGEVDLTADIAGI